MRSRTLVAALIATGLVGPGLAAQSADTLRLTL